MFQLNLSCIINWINLGEELLRIAKGYYNRGNGLIERLKVELTLEYIKTIKQQATRAPAYPSIVLQLAL